MVEGDIDAVQCKQKHYKYYNNIKLEYTILNYM